jgi:hypothetical protein
MPGRHRLARCDRLAARNARAASTRASTGTLGARFEAWTQSTCRARHRNRSGLHSASLPLSMRLGGGISTGRAALPACAFACLRLSRPPSSPRLLRTTRRPPTRDRLSRRSCLRSRSASIRDSEARRAGRRRVPSGCGAGGSSAARRTSAPPPSARPNLELSPRTCETASQPGRRAGWPSSVRTARSSESWSNGFSRNALPSGRRPRSRTVSAV